MPNFFVGQILSFGNVAIEGPPPHKIYVQMLLHIAKLVRRRPKRFSRGPGQHGFCEVVKRAQPLIEQYSVTYIVHRTLPGSLDK